jgi:hypothetical protein
LDVGEPRLLQGCSGSGLVGKATAQKSYGEQDDKNPAHFFAPRSRRLRWSDNAHLTASELLRKPISFFTAFRLASSSFRKCMLNRFILPVLLCVTYVSLPRFGLALPERLEALMTSAFVVDYPS